MGSTPTSMKRLIEAVTMFFVSAVSLLLLMYVGYGEGRRTYEQFYLDKLMTQGRVVQNAMETYLRPGLPMKQFVGFATLTEPILAADGAITALTAFDRSGAPVSLLCDEPPRRYTPSASSSVSTRVGKVARRTVSGTLTGSLH